MASKLRESEVLVNIPVEDRELSGIITEPCQSQWSGYAVILTHGAGGDMNFHHLVKLANHLAENGFLCLRFTCRTPNFTYRTKCYTAVVEWLKQYEDFEVKACVIGGRSMGARVAAEIACNSHSTQGFVLGLFCLSYPLHPPKRFAELRVTSLLRLGVPALFISGTKDNMCQRDLMDNVLRRMGSDWEMHWIENADHSLKINGKDTNDILRMLCDWVCQWSQSVFMAER